MTLYAIGDIHGQLGMLETVLTWIERDGGPDVRVVFLGDYVDRGPESRGVLELLSQEAPNRNWICLKGNHDRMLEWFLDDPEPRHDPHLLVGYHYMHDRIGGESTLRTYGIDLPDRIRMSDLARDLRAAVPEAHKTFLRGLRLCHQEAGCFFVHAGVRPGVALADQVENDLVWIREEFLPDTRDHGAYIVHGHTQVEAPDRRANRLNLDTGAGYDKPLTAVAIEAGEVFALTATGRVPVPLGG